MFLPTMPWAWTRSWLLLLWVLKARSGRLKPPTPLFSIGIFAATVLETQRLVVGQRVLETSGDVGGLGRTAHVVAQAIAVLVDRDDGVGLVVAAAVEAEANRRLALDDRTASAEVEVAILLGCLLCRKRVARVHRVAAIVEVAVAVPLAHVRPRDDLDLGPSGVVVVGRERVGAEPDLTNLIARRQPSAAEAVHLEHRARPAGHRREHLGELLGIVGQLFDLRLLERRALRVAAAIVERGRVVDDDFFLHAGDLQRDGLVHRAAPQGERSLVRLEPFELDVQLRRCPDGRFGDVARPRSSVENVTALPVAGVTMIVAFGMPAPVSSTTTRRSCV